jgi:hypothetical protein
MSTMTTRKGIENRDRNRDLEVGWLYVAKEMASGAKSSQEVHPFSPEITRDSRWA